LIFLFIILLGLAWLCHPDMGSYLHPAGLLAGSAATPSGLGAATLKAAGSLMGDAAIRLVRSMRDFRLEQLASQILIFLSGLGIFAGVASLARVRRQKRQKAPLLQAIQAYTAGDFSFRLPEPEVGELRQVSPTLNRMAASLEENLAHRAELANIFEIIPDQIMVLDAEQRVTRLNRAAAQFMKISPYKAIGRTCYELMHGSREPFPNCAFLKAMQQGSRACTEFCCEESGRAFLVTVDLLRNDEGRVTGAVHVARDITAGKQMQQELAQTSGFLTQLIESAPLAIAVVNRQGYITRVNPQYSVEYGYRPEEILQRHYSELYADEWERRQVLAELRERGEVLSRTVQFRHRDGREVPTRLSIRKLYNERGELIGSMGLGRNISEEVSLQRQLDHAQKLEAIAALSGGLAHNFNNLLMIIMGLVSLMLSRLEPSHPFYNDLKEIDNQVLAGRELTKKLLAFARGTKFEMQPLDLNDLVKVTADMFGRTRRDLVITQNLAPGLPPGAADLGQIQQVLLNLLINAWQAMPRGGRINIQTGFVDLKEWRDPAWEVQPGPHLSLSVSDTGVGMDRETQAHLFEPFFTTKGAAEGTGLGLASAYRIIKNHRGAIQVKSAPHQGTTFTILLPASQAPRRVQTQEDTRIIAGQGTILTVDDEPLLRQVAARLLKKLGYQVLEAPSGKRALEIFAQKQGEIDLVLLDLTMPGLSGFQTMERLRELNPGVRVLFCSGHGDLEGESLPHDHPFLPKPYSLEMLSQKVAAALQQG
jgi:PAS domain S-box-containing protein